MNNNLRSILCSLLLYFFISQAQALDIYLLNNTETNNFTKITQKSSYTTLGNPPHSILHSPVVFLSKNNISNDCWFSESTNISQLQQTIAIFHSIPQTWNGCAEGGTAIITLLANIFQKVGGIGVIVRQREKVNIKCFK